MRDARRVLSIKMQAPHGTAELIHRKRKVLSVASSLVLFIATVPSCSRTAKQESEGAASLARARHAAQESQAARDATVVSVQISPGEVRLLVDQKVYFAGVVFNLSGDPVG